MKYRENVNNTEKTELYNIYVKYENTEKCP